MNAVMRIASAAVGMALGTQAAAQITLFEREGFEGETFTTAKQIADFGRNGRNERAASIVVLRDRWEVCDGPRFSGTCVILRPGRYPSLRAMGLNDRVSSGRRVNGSTSIDVYRNAPAPSTVKDYGYGHNERMYEAHVTAVRAVVGPPEQRCWIEREQVVRHRSNVKKAPPPIDRANVGGILGHQVGYRRGQNTAAAEGGQEGYASIVERCETVPRDTRPEYWKVTYEFRGREHRIQTTAAPGPTVTVNEQGEPRQSLLLETKTSCVNDVDSAGLVERRGEVRKTPSPTTALAQGPPPLLCRRMG
jgi:uncharacterized protein YcfJ